MSSSARKIKLHMPPPKPRNPFVAAAAQRKAGSHRKSRAAERRADKMALQRQLKEV
ncbi:MAG TPA: hypothetical protein VHA82_22665 [Ramlibacter sp.]|uniref:hypothetical protein n=1 Tax=Ramlibacter sp. TaxID=1917967 RepID=UPI002C8505C2|nr:hypothetical protein [Ramlibacter sp.]HVZ46626.1 hypothetical protein [Ramlibacter sp.]